VYFWERGENTLTITYGKEGNSLLRCTTRERGKHIKIYRVLGGENTLKYIEYWEGKTH
jgi:hypothetical protein